MPFPPRYWRLALTNSFQISSNNSTALSDTDKCEFTVFFSTLDQCLSFLGIKLRIDCGSIFIQLRIFGTRKQTKALTNLWRHRVIHYIMLSMSLKKTNMEAQSDWNLERKMYIRQTRPGQPVLWFNISNSPAVSVHRTIFSISNTPACIPVHTWRWGYRVQCAPKGITYVNSNLLSWCKLPTSDNIV